MLNKLFPIYFWSILLVRYISLEFNIPIFNLLLLTSITLIVISFFYFKSISKSFLLVLIPIFSVFFIDYLFSGNFNFELLNDLLIYGVLPCYFFSFIEDYQSFIHFFKLIGLLILILYFREPFNDFYYTIDYMVFGSLLLLPLGASMIYSPFKNKIINIAILFVIFSLSLFSNRSTFLALFAYFIYQNYNFTLKSTIVYFTLFSIIYKNIFLIIDYLLLKFAFVNVYALRSLSKLVENDSNFDASSNRFYIWEKAFELIEKNLLGIGYSNIETKLGLYPHNIILDLTLSFGIVFSGIFYFLFFYRIKFLFSNQYIKNFLMFLFSNWVIFLMFSSRFTLNVFFWITIMVIFMDKKQFYKKTI